MKKILAAVAALAVSGLLLAGCSDSNNTDVNETGNASVETTVESIESTNSELSEETTESTEEIVDPSDIPEEVTDDESPDEIRPVFNEEEPNPLQNLVLASMGDFTNWPYLDEVTDEFIFSDYFLLDKNNENYEEIIAMQCPMSAQMCEIIIIKANDVESAKADLEARQKKAQDTDAFYPDDIERAANSIVGTKGDYAYFFICPDPVTAEQLLTEAISE